MAYTSVYESQGQPWHYQPQTFHYPQPYFYPYQPYQPYYPPFHYDPFYPPYSPYWSWYSPWFAVRQDAGGWNTGGHRGYESLYFTPAIAADNPVTPAPIVGTYDAYGPVTWGLPSPSPSPAV